MVKIIPKTHQSLVARYEVVQAAAFQMCPDWTVKQDVTTKKYPVNPVQKANVIRSLTRCVDYL